MTDWQKLAEEAVKETRENVRSYIGEVPLGETWAIVYGLTRDTRGTAFWNYYRTKRSLENLYQGDIIEERFRHALLGHIDHLLIRMLDGDGRVTKIGKDVLRRKLLREAKARDRI